MYLIDTSTLSRAQGASPESARLAARMREQWDQVSICPVTLQERLDGAIRLIKKVTERGDDPTPAYELFCSILEDLARFRITPYSSAADRQFRAIPPAVRRAIGVQDSRIAAVALANGLVLVTLNTRDFSRVPGLRIEDWGLLDPGGVPSPPWHHPDGEAFR